MSRHERQINRRSIRHMQTPNFKASLRTQIKDTISWMKRNGTDKTSLDCLFQNLRLGALQSAQDAPRGTNAAFIARQIFNDLVNATPAFQAFASLAD